MAKNIGMISTFMITHITAMSFFSEYYYELLYIYNDTGLDFVLDLQPEPRHWLITFGEKQCDGSSNVDNGHYSIIPIFFVMDKCKNEVSHISIHEGIMCTKRIRVTTSDYI